MEAEPMIPYSGPAWVAAPSAPCPRSFAREALAQPGGDLPPFGCRRPRQIGNPRGNSLAHVLFVLALCLTVVSRAGAVSAADQVEPDSVVAGKSPLVDTWSGMMARDQHTLAQRSGTPQVEEAPLRIPEAQRRFLPQGEVTPSAPSEKLGPQPEAPQTLSTSFQTISLQDQFDAFSSGSIPPDTMGAVGPNHFMEVINSSVAVYTKSGTRLSHVSLDSFFTADFSGTTYPRNGSFDPRVLYDRRSGRWFAIALERGNPSGTQNHVILAVSGSSDPTGSWSKYLVPVGVPDSGSITYFSDYDTLGTDDNGVYVAVRIFPSTGESYARIAAMQKTTLLSGTASTVYFFTSLSDMWSTPQPAHNLDPLGGSDPAWFVSSSTTAWGNVNYRRLTWSGGVPSLDESASVLTTPAYGGNPLNAPASGSAIDINVGDDRLQMAVIRGTNLWTCRNVGLDSAGGSGTPTRTGCEWLQLSLTSGSATLVQSGRVYDPAASNPRYYYYPSIMVSGQGHAGMGFSGSSSTEYVGAYFTGRLSGDTSGTMGSIALIKAGEASYQLLDSSSPQRNRWGDYSYTSLDPNDDMSLWTLQEYATSSADRWGTWAARLLAPPPATPASCSPPSVAAGQVGVNVTVTGTQVSGSGFFDPGTGFPNRLSAVVNGGGVTVNSVTYSSPTAITINVTLATSATAGARSITVTNPDGQTATSSSGILTVTAVVAGRAVFYNHSAWDGNDAAADANDDNAVAANKTALLPGGTATFASYTSYSRGLNGIMVDIAGLPATPTVSDFTFKAGNDNTPSGWNAAPAPLTPTVRAGAGAGGSDRVTLIWNDNNLDGVVDANEAVAKQWLQVTVKATANTGLATADVFYFGNAVGDSGNSAANAQVDLGDEIGARNHTHTFLDPAPLDDLYDYDRDQRVDLADQIIARNHGTTFLTAVKLIDLSSAAPAPASFTRAAVEPPQALTIKQRGTAIWIACHGSVQITPVLTTTMDLARGVWTSVSTPPSYSSDDSSWTWYLDPSAQTTQAFYRLAGTEGN